MMIPMPPKNSAPEYAPGIGSQGASDAQERIARDNEPITDLASAQAYIARVDHSPPSSCDGMAPPRPMKSLEYDFPLIGEFSVLIQRAQGAPTELLIGHWRRKKWDWFDYELNTVVPTTEEIEFAVALRNQKMPDDEKCIHPGVFATDRPSEHCYTCDSDVPRHEL